ncbi:MAG: enoyl-CoA hydratase family protein [Myxococcota bacterium]|nr:enoyl-CoA hydratase family protein [Myxococcota bacterium]
MAIRTEESDGVVEVVIDNPPVNALDSAGWFTFAETIRREGGRSDVHCLVVRAEGRGFQAGVDIKELQADGTKIVDVNRGCYESFAAVYDCPIPVISAVHGYCIGGGIGIAGSSDFVVASEDATFALTEIDRGALGAATHLMRMFGVQKTRRMLYTAEAIDAAEALRIGGVESVVPREKLRDEVLTLARTIASKSPKALRLAKWSLNGIELLDPKESYRYEQGFTLELYTSPDSQEARDAFVEKRQAEFGEKFEDEG